MLKRSAALLLALWVLMLATAASAHVTVWPKQATAGGYERYTVRVPNEKEIPTVKVRVELPAGATFSSVLPVAGWQYEVEKDASNRAIAVTWSGGEIKAGEFLEFGLSVRNAREAGEMVWKAYQTYSDGSVVEWTGPAGSESPASVTTLAVAAADDHGHGAPAAPAPAPAPSPAPTPEPTAAAGGGLGTWLGGGALLLSSIALIVALRK